MECNWSPALALAAGSHGSRLLSCRGGEPWGCDPKAGRAGGGKAVPPAPPVALAQALPRTEDGETGSQLWGKPGNQGHPKRKDQDCGSHVLSREAILGTARCSGEAGPSVCSHLTTSGWGHWTLVTLLSSELGHTPRDRAASAGPQGNATEPRTERLWSLCRIFRKPLPAQLLPWEASSLRVCVFFKERLQVLLCGL